MKLCIKLGSTGALILLCGSHLAAQAPATPRLGVNISRGFAYTCPATDSTCSPYVDYAAIPAYSYTDAQGQRTPFANWVRDQALPPLKSAGMSVLRIFFSPGADMACHGCGYSGGDIGHRPYLLTRGSPYLSGQSFGTTATPGLQPWVYSNLKMFFQDVASAGLEVDLVLQWDENYGNWTAPSGNNIFVGYPALRDIWLNAAQALVDSGAMATQIEPYQEEQFFQTSVEDHPVALDPTPGFIQSRIVPPGDWGNQSRGQYATDLMDATLPQLQAKFPQIAGRIFPGLELRAESGGACNSQTFNGWGDGPWATTDAQSYYAYVASRNLVFPWTINMHRYVGLDLNGNPEETVAQAQAVFDDLYAFHSGDTKNAATKCPSQPVSPRIFTTPPLMILGEVNSDAVITWSGVTTITQAYKQSRLSQWIGGYGQTLLMPWFFGLNLDPWDPQSTMQYVQP
jgi:hypothetical protein